MEIYIVQGDVACMADVETFGGNRSEHPRFRIYFLLFGRSQKSVGFCISSLVIDMNIAQCHIFNKGSRYSADNGGVARVGIKYIDVADEDALHCAHGRSLRAAHPGS